MNLTEHNGSKNLLSLKFDEIKIEEHQIDPIESQIMDQTSQDNEMSSSPTKDLDSKKDILQEAVSQISADTTG